MNYRIIMEEFLGRKLKPGEIVHHINGDHDDNRIENLQLCKDQQEHLFIHFGKNYDEWLKECRDQRFRAINQYLGRIKKPFKL